MVESECHAGERVKINNIQGVSCFGLLPAIGNVVLSLFHNALTQNLCLGIFSESSSLEVCSY